MVLTPPLSGALNMAVDVALMARARATGEAVFRIYTWSVPTLSFGRNQTARGCYDLDRIQALGIGTVRRPTGGRAILHQREVTYSVTAPANDDVGLRQSYVRINQILLTGLRTLGVPAEVAAPHERAERPTAAPCFAAPSAGEMTADGRKLVGSAQWREDAALLQHGSILIDDDQTTLGSLMLTPPPSLPAPGTLGEVLGRVPTADEVAQCMFSAVRAIEDPSATALDPTQVVASGAKNVDDFLVDEWTWRR
jgi:lipoate-protein ligase A